MKKQRRNGSCHAERKQTRGMVTAPKKNPADATGGGAGKWRRSMESTKARFKKPVPKNEMWPRRNIRRRQDAYPPNHSELWKNIPIVVPVISPAKIANQAARKFRSCIGSASLAYDDEMGRLRASDRSFSDEMNGIVSPTGRIVTGAGFGKSERVLTSPTGKPKR
jgi:hypothetical protein